MPWKLIARDMRPFSDQDKYIHKCDAEFILTEQPVPRGYVEMRWTELGFIAVDPQPRVAVPVSAPGLESPPQLVTPTLPPPPPAPLSPRAAEVHALRAEGLGYAEIASRLQLSVGTVKKYAQDARNREKAAA